jgi:hypothetical protein
MAKEDRIFTLLMKAKGIARAADKNVDNYRAKLARSGTNEPLAFVFYPNNQEDVVMVPLDSKAPQTPVKDCYEQIRLMLWGMGATPYTFRLKTKD